MVHAEHVLKRLCFGWPEFDYEMSPSRVRAIHLLIAVLVLGLDRWTKRLASSRIAMYRHIQIIPGFFRLTHTENTGAAFSLFADSPSHWKTAMLIGFSLVAMIVVSLLLWKQSHNLNMTGIALSLILGGAVGNLWDRVASGRVVDFLLFYLKQYQWPVFNLADSAIVLGAFLLVIEILFSRAHLEA
jgi:signal peptidase II